jgi:hypothetical protein
MRFVEKKNVFVAGTFFSATCTHCNNLMLPSIVITRNGAKNDCTSLQTCKEEVTASGLEQKMHTEIWSSGASNSGQNFVML